MADRLKDKIAFVTGAGSIGPGWGNGKAVATLFAREGAKIFALDINAPAAEETRDIVTGEGGECTAYQADVTKADEVAAAVEACIAAYGRIDVLHNNVGIVESGGPVETSEESWDRGAAVNLKSVYLTCKYVLPHMERQGGGSIINMASAAIDLAVPGYGLYAATKAAVTQLTQSFAVEAGPDGIRVNVLAPGLTLTNFTKRHSRNPDGSLNPEKYEAFVSAMRKTSPLDRVGEAIDQAWLVLYLASDASRFCTGQIWRANGGAAIPH